ncbi:MAG TPA: DNA double-strand break repair nuclease NurA [Anaerolineales bacterium]|nr:DNA double-strand break repair nuclease NurA [Anaerolineales bacterium]
MPINFQEIYQQIQTIGKSASERRKTLQERRELARNLLATYSSELDYLRRRVDIVREIDSNVRCAYPLDEALASSYPPPAAVMDGTLIAADGSQINPDRHAAVQFCLINVGTITMRLNSGTTTDIGTRSELLYGDDLFPNGNPMSEGMVAMRRDISERTAFDELSKEIPGQVVTFTDGPVELWGAKSDDPQSYSLFVDRYLGVLSRLQSRGVITAGYVDKPSADLVIRLLELAIATDEQRQKLREYHPLRGVSDRWLYGESANPLLPPGHRSAVFHMQSSSEKNYTGVLSLHFFYLNVGTEGHPWPVRVEIPKWVADDKARLDLLHCVFIEQCKMMGSKPYPYLLHRAHEVAVVKHEEKLQVEQMLIQELRRQSDEIDDGSNKQSAKDRGGRTAYKR